MSVDLCSQVGSFGEETFGNPTGRAPTGEKYTTGLAVRLLGECPSILPGSALTFRYRLIGIC